MINYKVSTNAKYKTHKYQKTNKNMTNINYNNIKNNTTLIIASNEIFYSLIPF